MSDILVSISAAGAINGLAVASAVAYGARRDARNVLLALFFGTAIAIVLAILVSHRTSEPASEIAMFVEQALALAAGPILYSYIRSSTGHALNGCAALALATPVLAYLVLLLGQWLEGSNLRPLSLAPIVAFQVSCTAAATWHYVTKLPVHDRSLHAKFWPLLILPLMWAVHFAQIARVLLGGADDFMRDIVPIVGGLSLNGAVLLLLLRLRQHWTRSAPRYDKSGVNEAELKLLCGKIAEAMTTARLYRDPQLTLAKLAEYCSAQEHQVSEALAAMNTGFAALLAHHRVAEAKSLLLDRANRRVSVDALGREAGFGSRSAFYKTFREATGLSPASFKLQARSDGRTG